MLHHSQNPVVKTSGFLGDCSTSTPGGNDSAQLFTLAPATDSLTGTKNSAGLFTRWNDVPQACDYGADRMAQQTTQHLTQTLPAL